MKYTLNVDFNNKIAEFKKINGVNNFPWNKSARKEFQTLNCPVIRLHDTGLFTPRKCVDVTKIFPDFNADENDEKNYRFKDTDKLMEATVGLDADIIFRLGTSAGITGKGSPDKTPPKDFAKWTSICEHIVAHLTEGWANGHRFPIKYLEIWNEPDLKIFWTGSETEFFSLYKIASLRLKQRFPSILVGGCSFAVPQDDMTDNFLAFVKENNLPLDFFSWHQYHHEPRAIAEIAAIVKTKLAKYGFENTPSIYDEWNFNINFHEQLTATYKAFSTIQGASFVAAMLTQLQKMPIDVATYYDAQTNYLLFFYNGLFDLKGFRLQKGKAFYAFKMFDTVKQNGIQVFSDDTPPIYSVASVGKDKGCVMFVNYAFTAQKDVDLHINLGGCPFSKSRIFSVTKKADMKIVYDGEIKSDLFCPNESVWLIEYYN